MNSRSMKRKTCNRCHVSKFHSDVSVCLYACIFVCACVCTDFYSPAKSLFPARSKVGGGYISTSLHYRERGGGGLEEEEGDGGGIFATKSEGTKTY